jgi:hypothetical protein
VVSSPGQTLQKEQVMQMVEAVASTRSDLIFGYDWAGSSTADERDLTDIDWSDGTSVASSFWFKGFCERIKGQILALVQLGYTIRLICIEGGPISQLEAKTMALLRAQAMTDLRSQGVDLSSVVISSQCIHFEDFKRAFSPEPSSPVLLSPPTTQADRGREGVVAAALAADIAACSVGGYTCGCGGETVAPVCSGGRDVGSDQDYRCRAYAEGERPFCKRLAGGRVHLRSCYSHL